MARIRIFDSTRREFGDGFVEPPYGDAVMDALDEFSRYRELRILGADPRVFDPVRYETSRMAEHAALSEQGRLDGHKLVHALISFQRQLASDLEREVGAKEGARLYPIDGVDTIIVSGREPHAERARLPAFQVRDGSGNNHIVLSAPLLKDQEILSAALLHSLGHIYGAAPAGRIHTEGSRGSHCVNVCVMRHSENEHEMRRLLEGIRDREHKFCQNCRDDLYARCN